MKLKITFAILILSCPLIIYGQAVLTTLDNYYDCEYRATLPSSYWAELLDVWRVSNLQHDQAYTFQFYDYYGTDAFDMVVYDSRYDYYWDKPYDTSPEVQTWTWKGPNNFVDYFSLDVYVDDYSDVEIGLYGPIYFGITQGGTTWGVTTGRVITSMELTSPPALDCSNPVSYTLSNLATGGSASWIIKQNGTTRASGTGTSATANNITNGKVDLDFTVSFPYGLESLTFSEEYGFGVFNSTVVTGQAPVCPNSLYVYTADVPGGHSSSYSYSWTYPSGWYYYSQWSNNIHLQTPILLSNMTYGPVRVSITNACGTSGYSGITTYPGYNCGGYYMATPNPSTDYTDIDIIPEMVNTSLESYKNKIFISIYDNMGTPVLNAEANNLPYRIDTSILPKGEYLIRIITTPKSGVEENQRVETLKIIVNH